MAAKEIKETKKKMYIFQGTQFKLKTGAKTFDVYKRGDKVELTKKQVKPFVDLFIPCE